jgi:hypothetical protein
LGLILVFDRRRIGIMPKMTIHARVYSPLNLDTDMDFIRARLDGELAEMMADGIPISYCDPAYGGRLVREYPDGHKVFLVRDERKRLRETPIEVVAKAA